MNIGVLSDIHDRNNSLKIDGIDDLIKSILNTYVGDDNIDTFIIAGDIDEHPSRVIYFLKRFKILSNIENIIFIPGNHEHYIFNYPFMLNKKWDDQNYYSYLPKEYIKYEKLQLLTPFEKVTKLVEAINYELGSFGVIATNDGKMFEIDDISFSGTCGWYDGSYLEKKIEEKNGKGLFSGAFFMEKSKDVFFKENADSLYILNPMDNPYYLWDAYYEDIIKNIDQADVIITHIISSVDNDFIDEKFRGSDSNAFFTFNGMENLKKKNPKIVISGHSHSFFDKTIEGIRYLRNPYGYPSEVSKSNPKIIIFNI